MKHLEMQIETDKVQARSAKLVGEWVGEWEFEASDVRKSESASETDKVQSCTAKMVGMWTCG